MKLLTTTLLFFIAVNLDAFDHTHLEFDRVLKDNVVLKNKQSYVKYEQIKKNPQLLNSYTSKIEAVSAKEYETWSKEEKMAFLINAYNALTIKLILTKYPNLESIKDLGGFFSSPWKKEFFTLFGKKRHLDYIEHQLLRKKFQDARIHFAIVCASKGCPALVNHAYIAAKLDSQLSNSMKNFITDKTRNRYNQKKNRLELSSIFKWFKDDFKRDKGTVGAFVAPTITSDKNLQKKLSSQDIDISYLDYDWSLNKI